MGTRSTDAAQPPEMHAHILVTSILPLGSSNKMPELDLRLYEDLHLITRRLLMYADARP